MHVKLSFILYFLIPILLLSCNMPISGSDAHQPPFTIHSIIPLKLGTRWDFNAYMYGSAGELISADTNLSLYINNAWAIKPDGTLENYQTTENFTDSNNICFGYQWGNQKDGLIIQYKQDTIPGIYIIGTFDFKTSTLFSQPKLWLAYPSEPGFTYFFTLDSLPDSSQIKIEVVSVKESFYFADIGSQSVTGLTSKECYLYKENTGDTINYYYYNPEYGALGYQQIYHGQIRKTFILRSRDQH